MVIKKRKKRLRKENQLFTEIHSVQRVLGTLETVGANEGNIANCEWKCELNHLSGVQIQKPCLTLKHFLITAAPPNVPCPDLSASE